MTDSENHSRWNFQEGPRSRRVKVTKHQRRKLERWAHCFVTAAGRSEGEALTRPAPERLKNKFKWEHFFIVADIVPQTRFTRCRLHYQTEAFFSCQVSPSSNQNHQAWPRPQACAAMNVRFCYLQVREAHRESAHSVSPRGRPPAQTLG